MLDETKINFELRNKCKAGCIWPSKILGTTIYIKMTQGEE
jgi:hypothetical protein